MQNLDSVKTGVTQNMANLKDSLAKDFSDIRKQNKDTLNNVAFKMGTNSKQIWRLEKGKVDPHLSTIERFANALGYGIQIVFVKNA